ncbi:MAG TPA: hypothetical protein VIA18_10520, partial [Polyangia bacterium]|nr:hypothetical protein [Polyangia bacterium]
MNDRARRLAPRIFAVAGALVALALFVHALPSLRAALHDYPYDGKVDWIAARAFWDGRNPYSP